MGRPEDMLAVEGRTPGGSCAACCRAHPRRRAATDAARQARRGPAAPAPRAAPARRSRGRRASAG
jgi:hypothetical protein